MLFITFVMNESKKLFYLDRCCTDLKDDDMEITVLRGLSYNVPNPKTIDTYVKIEVPLPNTVNLKAFQSELCPIDSETCDYVNRFL